MTVADTEAERKTRVSAWIEELRDRICAAFETLERDHKGQLAHLPPGTFERKSWNRAGEDGTGGGVMSIMHGRVFEKVGVNVSTTFGKLSPNSPRPSRAPARIRISGPAGISLVAHMQNPHVPAVHMNTRHMVTTKGWFGGGVGPDADVSERGGRAPFSRRAEARLRCTRRRLLPALQEMVRRVLLSAAPQRSARRRAASSTTISTAATGRRISPSCGMSASHFSRSIPTS